jgi:hypothetical protein
MWSDLLTALFVVRDQVDCIDELNDISIEDREVVRAELHRAKIALHDVLGTLDKKGWD